MSPSARRTRVLLVAPRFPPDVGGMESYAGWVAEVLRDTPGFDVMVLSTTPAQRGLTERVNGVEVIRLPTLATVSNTPVHPWWPARVARLVRRLQPDVINLHAPVPGLADVTAFTAGRTPLVLTYHAGSLAKGIGGPVDALLRGYERHLLPRVFERCTELIAVSPVSLAFHTGRATLVPPGVDVATFHPGHPSPGSPSRGPRILFAGRLERTSRWKGVHVLLEALPRVLGQLPEARLDVAGDGDALPGLRAQAVRLGVAHAVTWWGRLSRHELAGRYREAGVTVLPSLTEAESFGMTLVEAMASGCPVVGSRVGGIPYVVRDGVDGVLAEPGDPGSLATAILQVLGDPAAAARMGRAGREAATTRWDWAHERDITLEVLTRAAGARC